MDIPQIIDKLRLSFELFKFQNEQQSLTNIVGSLKNTNKEQDKIEITEDRLVKLDAIIKNIQEKQSKYLKSKKSLFEDVDKMMYSREWKYLTPIHRSTKITEFLEETIPDDNIRADLIDKFNKLVFDKKLNTNKSVIYDVASHKITDIPVLKYENESYQIVIKK